EVLTTKIAQEELADYINKNDISVLIVRSATQVRKDILDACEGLKMIGRAGVGLDNIDTDEARKKGVKVINTPSASSRSVAELVMAHLFGGIRHLQKANREMPLEGETNFKKLKKSCKGRERYGRTLGIIGFGRIGHHVAQLALGIGMKVVVNDKFLDDQRGEEITVPLSFPDGQKLDMKVKVVS